jgi:hypothetical protein
MAIDGDVYEYNTNCIWYERWQGDVNGEQIFTLPK